MQFAPTPLKKKKTTRFRKNMAKPKRRRISNSLRLYLAWKQKWCCKKCGELLPPTFQVDHIRPLSEGGSNDVVNLQILCIECHGMKTFWETNLRAANMREEKTGVSKYFDFL